MNRTIIPIAFIAISFLTLNAKRISGVIVDDDSNPIEFANITAFKNDSVAGGGISDASGIFCIEVDNECNRLRISLIGYDDVTISPAETDLGKITLRKTSTTLKEVVVKAPLVRRTTDRIVLNVAENPLSANKDAHEIKNVLKRI